MKGFHERLLLATEIERREFMSIEALRRGVLGDIGLPTYEAFLAQAYHHVKHTVPLLMACGARLPERLEWLREAVGEYIREEMGHQEWILGDIAACGADADVVRESRPEPATELMVAYAYDTVTRHNPVGLFGMVLVLEGTSVRLATDAAAALQERLGLPDNALRYLRSHGALDVGHLEHFARLMDRLHDTDDQAAVLHRARMFYRLYGDIFRSLPLTAAPLAVAAER